MRIGLRLPDDLSRQSRGCICSNWLHLSPTPPPKAVPAHALVSPGGGQRKNVNGTFPDSHPS